MFHLSCTQCIGQYDLSSNPLGRNFVTEAEKDKTISSMYMLTKIEMLASFWSSLLKTEKSYIAMTKSRSSGVLKF